MILFLLFIALLSITYKERKRAILAGTDPEVEWEVILVTMVAFFVCSLAVICEFAAEITAILTLWNYLPNLQVHPGP